MFFACTQNAGHVTGIIFGIVDNPYQAGVLGKIGPYLPCSTLSSKKPPLGIAMAAGFVQSSCFDLSDMSLLLSGLVICVAALILRFIAQHPCPLPPSRGR